MQHHPLDPIRPFFFPSDPTAILEKELPDNLLRLIIPLAEYVFVTTGRRDTRVSVRPKSILLDRLLVLGPPLLHAVVHLQMRHDDHDGHLAVAEHLYEEIVRLLHRNGHPSTLHAEHEEADPARPL